MADETNKWIKKIISFGKYKDFKGLKFEIIELSNRRSKLESIIPTYIRQSSGHLKLSAWAHTIIKGNTGDIILNAYAPILIRDNSGDISAELRDNTTIEACSGNLTLSVAPYLDVIIERDLNKVINYIYHKPKKERGVVLIRGGSGNINLKYDPRLG